METTNEEGKDREDDDSRPRSLLPSSDRRRCSEVADMSHRAEEDLQATRNLPMASPEGKTLKHCSRHFLSFL